MTDDRVTATTPAEEGPAWADSPRTHTPATGAPATGIPSTSAERRPPVIPRQPDDRTSPGPPRPAVPVAPTDAVARTGTAAPAGPVSPVGPGVSAGAVSPSAERPWYRPEPVPGTGPREAAPDLAGPDRSGTGGPEPRAGAASFPDDETVLLAPRPGQVRQRIVQPGGGLRARLWRDFGADPLWRDGEPPTSEIPLSLRFAPAIPVPSGPPGSKVSVPPRGLGEVTRYQTEMAVPYPGRRRVETFVPMFGRADHAVRVLFVAGWVTSMAAFWHWWVDADHVVSAAGFVLNSLLLLYLCYLPIYFVLAAVRLRRVNPALPVRDLRVAFVVTKAPSEPWSVVHRTLRGMLAQDYPHHYDVWVLDEDPDEDTYRWCERHGVGLSTRRGFPEYHRKTWPRRTKCKEGNLSFFYDHWGYDFYDVAVQLDADHVPAPGYLAEMVRPFADPKIGYVAAPSICDANAASSWAARGRLYREANLHGPVQVGSNGWLAPVCFGSHYAVRTAALREIGGIGPELAEDFSTTYLLCAAGWDGAFAIDAQAHGDGPETFAAMLTQEFQWSRSLTVCLTDIFFQNVRRLPWLLRARFLTQVVFYPLLALMTGLGLLLAPLACFSGISWVRVDYPHFLAIWGLGSAMMLGTNAYLRRRGLFRPRDGKLVAWEMWLFSLTRWPYAAWGVLSGLLQKVRPKPVTFTVTPKGSRGVEKLPVGLLTPYVLVCLLAEIAAIVGSALARPGGYVLLCLLCAASYVLVLIVVSAAHAAETMRTAPATAPTALRTVAAPIVVIIGLVSLLGVGVASAAASYGELYSLTIKKWVAEL